MMALRWKGRAPILIGMLLLLAVAGLFAANGFARWLGFGDPPLIIVDPDIEYYPIPNRSYRRFGNAVVINRYGMRSDDFDRTALSKGDHYALLGDSVVYGNHHIDQSATIAATLQRALRQHAQRPRSVVSSIAASSWGPRNVFEYYRRIGPFPGRIAVVIVSTHDMVDVPHVDQDVIPYRRSMPASPLHDMLTSVVERAQRRFGPVRPGPSFEERRRQVDQALDELLTVLEADFSEVWLLFHPTRDEVTSGEAIGQGHFQGRAAARGVKFGSLMSLYRQAHARGARIHEDDVHLSAEGTSVLAAHIFSTIVNPPH